MPERSDERQINNSRHYSVWIVREKDDASLAEPYRIIVLRDDPLVRHRAVVDVHGRTIPIDGGPPEDEIRTRRHDVVGETTSATHNIRREAPARNARLRIVHPPHPLSEHST